MMKKRTLGCICGGLLLGAFLYWQNNGLILTKMTYRGEIPAGFDGYKILQIADLQNKVFGRRQEQNRCRRRYGIHSRTGDLRARVFCQR